jgi:hypothetical protein
MEDPSREEGPVSGEGGGEEEGQSIEALLPSVFC